MSLCCVTMKLAVCLMLAFVTSSASSPGCHCDFTNRQYKGTFKYSSYRPYRVQVEGTFNVDLDGYYFRADLNHPDLGPMHFYKDNSDHVICYEKTPEHCDRNENLIFAFPECVYNHSIYSDRIYFYKEDIDGRKYYEHYNIETLADDTCKPFKITWSYDSKASKYYAYDDITVDEKRAKSFYLQEIREFSGLNIDEIIFG